MERQIRMSTFSATCASLVWVVALLSPAGALPRTVGDAAATKAAAGEKYYQQGRYQQALNAYRDAQLEDPKSALLKFNIGAALYKTGDLERALNQFQDASENGPDALKAGSLYNVGNVYFQQEQYARAVEAFRHALAYDWQDDEARANLELALLRVKQQQQPRPEEGEKSEEEGEAEPTENQGRKQGEDQKEGERQQEVEQQNSDEELDPDDQPSDLAQDASRSGAEAMALWEAEQLLDAFEDRELEAQRLRYRASGQNQRKDW